MSGALGTQGTDPLMGKLPEAVSGQSPALVSGRGDIAFLIGYHYHSSPAAAGFCPKV